MKKLILLLLSCLSVNINCVEATELAACTIMMLKCAAKGTGTVVTGMLTGGMCIGSAIYAYEGNVTMAVMGSVFAYGLGVLTHKLYESTRYDFNQLRSVAKKQSPENSGPTIFSYFASADASLDS